MTVPTHSVKHVRNKYRKLQLLAAFFATLTIAAAFLAAASGLQATLLKKKQLPSTAHTPSSDIQKEKESDQQIDSLNAQLSAEKSTAQALRRKVTKLERRLAAIQKTVSPAKKTQPIPETIPVPKQFPALEKAQPKIKKTSPAESAPSTTKPGTTPPVQPKPKPQTKPAPVQVPKSMPIIKPEPAPAPNPKPAVKPEPTPTPKPPVTTPKPVAEPKAVPTPKPAPVTQPIPAPSPVPETPEIKTKPEVSPPSVSLPIAPPELPAATPGPIEPDSAEIAQPPGEQSLETEEIVSENTQIKP